MSSVSDLITKAKHFDADTVSYKPASVNKRGGKNVSCTIKNSPIVLQFPLMLCWGVNERVDENSGRVSYDLSLDFRNETSATRAMLANLKKFEKKIKEDSILSLSILRRRMIAENLIMIVHLVSSLS